MIYRVELSDDALKALKEMDKQMAIRIYSWISKNLDGCTDPRRIGKALSGNYSGEWRYRIGDYRLLAVIKDDVITILILEIGHRSKVYND